MRLVVHPLLGLPRPWKRTIAIGVDAALCAITVWLAYYLRLGVWMPMNGRPMLAIALSILLAIPVFAAFGLYRVVFRYAGADAVASSATACAVYGLGYFALITAYGFDWVPRTVGLIQPGLMFIAVAASRGIASVLLTKPILGGTRTAAKARVLIYGAGVSGRHLAQVMAASDKMKIVGFIDDDASLHQRRVRRFRVYSPRDVESQVKSLGVTDVLLAIPSASRARRAAIIEELTAIGVRVRKVPDMLQLAHGTVHVNDFREVTINDLLQRSPVEQEVGTLFDDITDNVILVTGAGGSIGCELCRQIIAMKPAKLLLVETSEYSLYSINEELAPVGGDRLVPLLASVVDATRMDTIIRTWKPRMIFHAAAFKHVPLVEHNPLEGLRNNVIGTAVIAELAVQHDVRDFVLISTDKAVRPTNVMGASKRLAELVLQGLSTATPPHSTCFSMVRFGNVLGSSGSVVPLFSRQIQQGGPLTITHPGITRYFMTIPEAVQLVLQASSMAHGGEVFVLDMGDPILIRDLARNMIHLSGLTVRDETRPDGDIEISVIGLRPGEKLYEELLIGDNPMPTAHPRIMKATEDCLPWSVLRRELDRLRDMIEAGEVLEARSLVRTLVPEFSPISNVVDWTMLECTDNLEMSSMGIS
ncbi:polysaccharide biosynthesis protein [Sphingomonas panacisoli]|uniref:Polysaccharide biosynthesis protein n=1 Tax=Sphingomonas panacisoli TaxID=1813879 RepID=A0A5B8LPK1_9SPHN|nr:nucleoside-diphosphate sugar epimerase/dehydratase [Sphingomonas panacisoli]QDZ09050.1 polysaccharide biosynthesis protein [Sphingomonas panacisoli]